LTEKARAYIYGGKREPVLFGTAFFVGYGMGYEIFRHKKRTYKVDVSP
jgi:hypothetical protein